MARSDQPISRLQRATLDNGLRLIVAPDRSRPLVAVAVVYDVGFRSEPEGRTGFAHLFEHLMFQGSANVGKVEHMQLIESAGGVMNGHTMPDLTAYYEALPSGGLELALWLEADRMGSLALNEENLRNQVAVVKEEIKVNVLNQPYGGFPWIRLPEVAFDSYPNSHNGYGDFSHLEEATVSEAHEFYADFYSPSNAVLAVAGDCEPDDVVLLARRHFGEIGRRVVPSHGPWPEPLPSSERHKTIRDRLIPQPAFVIGYRTPDPVGDLDAYLAFVALASLLGDSDASRLRMRLMHQDRSVTDVGCLLGIFGNDGLLMRDPALFQIVVFHPGTHSGREIIGAIDDELGRLAEEGPSAEEMERVQATSAAQHWRELDSVLNRALILASMESIHHRAELVDELPSRLASVDEAAIRRATSDLLDQNRTVVELQATSR